MMKMLPLSDTHAVVMEYWQDIIDIIHRINREGKTFYSRNFGKLEHTSTTLSIVEEVPQVITKFSTSIAKFYNERYKLMMRFGDSTTPLSGELYVLFRNENGKEPRVGYLKCNRGLITVRNMEPVDYSGEIIFKSLFMALPGPISYIVRKVGANEVEILEIKRERSYRDM